MEAKLQKLKVTELKELLSQHSLPQTGKKDELVKRLLENNVGQDGADTGEETAEASTSNGAPATAADAPQQTATAELASAEQPAIKESSLTAEQLAQKKRAERFGLPFNPNPTPRQSKPAPSSKTAPSTSAESKSKEKAGSIDKTSLGISDEVLAKRAARFGLPEKKAQSGAVAPASTPAASKPAEPEITPEMAEKIAIEEEKKRKRAEKFGTGPAAPSNGTTAVESAETPDAKKTKV